MLNFGFHGAKKIVTVTENQHTLVAVRLTGKHATHALVIQAVGAIDYDHVVGQILAQVLHGLGLARARRSLGASAAIQVQRRGQRDVTPVGQRRDDQSARVAQVLVTVSLLGVRLSDDDPFLLRVIIETQLRHPLEIGLVHAV